MQRLIRIALPVCLLAVLNLAGCKKTKSNFATHQVTIDICGAIPADVQVREGDHVYWQSDDQHDYTVRFSHPSEPTANPFVVKHGVPDFGHTIKGKRGCKDLGQGNFYCKYTLTKDNDQVPCADPGVHIIP